MKFHSMNQFSMGIPIIIPLNPTQELTTRDLVRNSPPVVCCVILTPGLLEAIFFHQKNSPKMGRCGLKIEKIPSTSG